MKTLGPYQIQAEIGRGGMATIYRAYDPRCGRWVALKVLPAYFQHNREFVARFAREAHNAAALAHPHIVPVYESGATAEQPYIAMAWADGGSLAEQLARRRGPLPLGQVADVLRQVASALDYAHARGVVHRDIKPANILLTRQGHAMLADFGIAKAVWESGLTQSGVRLGTPAYMAPEQARGGGVDARTDLYALGVVLYEMLTGAPPFQGDTDAVLYQHVHEPPPRLRARNPALPPALEKVVRRALEKDPRRRYGSGDELAAAFCAALPGSGPRGATPAPQSWPAGVGPAPVLLGLLGLALLVMALIVAGGRFFGRPSNRPALAATATITMVPTLTPAGATATETPTPIMASATATPLSLGALGLTLQAPEEGAEFLAGNEVTLRWISRDLGAGERFRVQVQRDGDALGLPGDGVTQGATELALPAETLTPGEYRWWVAVERARVGGWDLLDRTWPGGSFTILRPTPLPPPTWTPLPTPTMPPAAPPTDPPAPPPQCREVCDTCTRTVQDPVTGATKTEEYPCNCRQVCE